MNKFSYSAFFSFSLSSLEITYFTNLSFYSLRSYSNSGDNNLFFSNNRYNSVFFGKILAECQSPYVYDSLIQKCVIIDQKILDFQNFFNNALNNE